MTTVSLMLLLTRRMFAQGLRGSAQRYVKFLLASTAGYKELDRNGSLHAAGPGPQPHPHQAPAAQELHVHFMSHCEHHMLPFHGQVGGVCCPGLCLNATCLPPQP